jgi:hypothetical protein
MAQEQLLFYTKLCTNFVKVAPTYKVSKLDFKLGQTRKLLWSTKVKIRNIRSLAKT